MDDNLIPLAGMFLIFGLPLIGWITTRVLSHRERMAMLQRGLVPPPDSRAWRRMQRGNAEWAPPPWAASVPPQPAPPPAYGYGYDPDAQCTLRKGIRTSMVGLALLIGLSFIGYHSGDGPFGSPSIHPGPWLLGGLIPLFVGVAQMIIGLMGGAQFSLRPGMAPPPPSSPPPPNAGQRTYGQPAEPGRPGQRFEELARPVPPPDRL
jgi:hypothetical protein